MNRSTMQRRSFLQMSLGSLAFGLCAHTLGEKTVAAQQSPAKRADACILLWMNGGPSHIDTFDPKSSSKTGGQFKSIATKTPGLRLCEHLPRIAEQSHHFTICRGLNSREGNHDRAQTLAHTSHVPNPTIEHPSFGAWTSSELGSRSGDLPAFISLNGPSIGAGFLGRGHAPLVVTEAGRAPDNVTIPSNISSIRHDRRLSALQAMEADFGAKHGQALVTERKAVYEKAVRLMRSPGLSAFDVEQEPEAVKKAYSDTKFGRGCLAARRLVEAGSRFVEVTLDGWDTHQDNFSRTQGLLETLDPAMSALIADLAERKLLDRTVVLCMGEFGRSPQINDRDGRDHHPAAFSALIAGGGIRGGLVYGQTDPDGAKVIEKPISAADIYATVATLMGMDPNKSVMADNGRPISLTAGGSVLREIML